MKRPIYSVYITIIGLIIVLGITNNVAAEEELLNEQESFGIDPVNMTAEYALPEETSDASKPVEYIKGQLIVKLKNGCTLTDIQELAEKYNVISAEKVLNEAPPVRDTLTQLKQKLGELNAKHDKWYWQLEKDSAEYKDYIAKIEQEKRDITERIAFTEEIPPDKKEETPSPDTNTLNMENVFVQTIPEETDILLMASDYRKNPAVEYAEPNYTQ